MSSMNMRELPMWLKRCLIYDTISKMSEIPNDVSEIILRHLSSREQKNSHMMITELKDEIQKYNREEHIKFMKDESVWFDDPFYDHSIGRGSRGYWGRYYPGRPVVPQRFFRLSPLRENISSVVEKRLGFCPRAFCESFLPFGHGRQTYGLLMENDLGEAIVTSGKNVYNMNIGRFLSLSKCCIDFANTNMETCIPRHEEWIPGRLRASEFYEHVNPQIRGSYSCMSLKNKREQFYQHSEITAELLEEEAEYYLYLIKTSLLKVLPLKEIVLTPK